MKMNPVDPNSTLRQSLHRGPELCRIQEHAFRATITLDAA